jgi:DNA repair photolyase
MASNAPSHSRVRGKTEVETNFAQVNAPVHLPRVELIKRHGAVLHASPMPDHDGVLSLNLTRGCAHRCPFCSVRAQPNYPSDGVLYLYRDTAKQLAGELAERTLPPAAVFITPSSDPFPPLARIQAETARVIEVLASRGITTWLMTRGYIRPSVLQIIGRHADRVKVTVQLTTLDRSLQRSLEPLAAPPRLRIRQITQLRRLGIDVQVGLEPLLPGLTDTRQNLAPLLEVLAAVGVRHITAGYMFLRKTIAEHLQGALAPLGVAAELIEQYESGPLLASGSIAPARYLPKKHRQRGYAGIMALAAGYGITVRISATTNPDFHASRATDKHGERRIALPLFAEAGSRASWN